MRDKYFLFTSQTKQTFIDILRGKDDATTASIDKIARHPTRDRHHKGSLIIFTNHM